MAEPYDRVDKLARFLTDNEYIASPSEAFDTAIKFVHAMRSGAHREAIRGELRDLACFLVKNHLASAPSFSPDWDGAPRDGEGAGKVAMHWLEIFLAHRDADWQTAEKTRKEAEARRILGISAEDVISVQQEKMSIPCPWCGAEATGHEGAWATWACWTKVLRGSFAGGSMRSPVVRSPVCVQRESEKKGTAT